MNKNKTGIALCVIYALFVVVCLFGGYSSGGDDKGWVVMMQLPLIFISILLDLIHLGEPLLSQISWVVGYVIFVPLTFVLLYFTGWLIEYIFRFISVQIKKKQNK